MKIAFFPNICNNNYTLIKALKAISDIDAHLYITGDSDIQNLPESEDPELKDNYPDWIHKSNKWKPKHYLLKRDKSFINELNKYDVVVLADLAVCLAHKLRAKKIFAVTGGDLTRSPFPSEFNYKGERFIDKFKRYFIGYHQRKGMQYIDEFWTQPFSPFLDALKKLKIDKSKVKPALFRVFIDTEAVKYVPDALHQLPATMQQQLQAFSFVIFYPSRIMMSETPGLVKSGQWKNNQLLFKAFARFVKNNPEAKACLVLIDREFGGEIDAAKALIANLDIADNVVWLKPPNKQGFTKNELVLLYSLSHVVADDFGIGWFGSIVCEACACQKPVLCYVDQEAMSMMYDWHPIISSNTVEGVEAKLQQLYDNPEWSDSQGKKGLDWINQYHTFKGAGAQIAEALKSSL